MAIGRLCSGMAIGLTVTISAWTGIEAPSSTFKTFEPRARIFRIEYPSNWSVLESADGLGVTLAPVGGVVDAGGQMDLICGVVINHYEPFLNDADDSGGRFSFLQSFGEPVDLRVSRSNLAEATNDLLEQFVRTNPTLKSVQDSQRMHTMDGALAMSVVLSGRSAATGQEERVTVFTLELQHDRIVYVLFVAPALDYDRLTWTFNRMIESLRVTDDPAATDGRHGLDRG